MTKMIRDFSNTKYKISRELENTKYKLLCV